MLVAISTVGLARLQFATTSLYHFLFVPLTLGLGPIVAIFQTMWHRTRNETWLRLTRFFGTLFLINFAIGVATGLVQEFQFGMNWSVYSKFVGDVFGAPLAIEGLAAFMLESTFLGLWIFGWDRLSPRVHLATIWLAAAGTWLSAYFILVGLTTASTVVFGVACWHFARRRNQEIFRKAAKLALIVLVPVSAINLGLGSYLGIVMTEDQPMKIAATEAQWNTCQPCSFSLFQIGGGKEDETPTQILEIPHLLSLLATNHWNGQVLGLNQVNAQYQQEYGPGNYVPNVFIQYWSMRVMAYTASLVLILALWGAWNIWRKRLQRARWFLLASTWFVIAPFVMNTAGWFLTENGRQPWIVQGLMLTKNGVSPSVSTSWVWITLTLFILIYGIFAVVDGFLMVRYSRKPLADVEEEQPADEAEEDETLVLTY